MNTFHRSSAPADQGSTSPRLVWITGVAGTLGTALAQSFIEWGDEVIGFWHRNKPLLSNDRFHPVQMDLRESSAEALSQTLEPLPAMWKNPEILILNAGINEDRLLVQTKPEQWDSVLHVNLTSAFHWIRHFAAQRSTSKPRHVVAISSFGARHGHAGQSAYVASKAGLISLIQSAAREYADQSICCNVVFPGVMTSSMTAALSESQNAALVEQNLLRQLNDPKEVAAFILHLSGMRQVSGQVFQLDSRISPWT